MRHTFCLDWDQKHGAKLVDFHGWRMPVSYDKGILFEHEATRTSGFGAELSALVQEHCFYHLEAPIARVTGWDTPYPHDQEWDYFPGPARVGRALLETMEA